MNYYTILMDQASNLISKDQNNYWHAAMERVELAIKFKKNKKFENQTYVDELIKFGKSILDEKG